MPRFGLRSSVEFLIDTGADQTIVAPLAAVLLIPSFSLLRDEIWSRGFGGLTKIYVEPTTLSFTTASAQTLELRIEAGVLDPLERENWHLFSVLGRDVLRAFHLTVSTSADTVLLD